MLLQVYLHYSFKFQMLKNQFIVAKDHQKTRDFVTILGEAAMPSALLHLKNLFPNTFLELFAPLKYNMEIAFALNEILKAPQDGKAKIKSHSRVPSVIEHKSITGSLSGNFSFTGPSQLNNTLVKQVLVSDKFPIIYACAFGRIQRSYLRCFYLRAFSVLFMKPLPDHRKSD